MNGIICKEDEDWIKEGRKVGFRTAGFSWIPHTHLEKYALPTVFKKALRCG
jgi:hypothetical protein